MDTTNNDENFPLDKAPAVNVEVFPPDTRLTPCVEEMVSNASRNMLHAALKRMEHTAPAKLANVKTITFRQHFVTVPAALELTLDFED